MYIKVTCSPNKFVPLLCLDSSLHMELARSSSNHLVCIRHHMCRSYFCPMNKSISTGQITICTVSNKASLNHKKEYWHRIMHKDRSLSCLMFGNNHEAYSNGIDLSPCSVQKTAQLLVSGMSLIVFQSL